MAAGCFALELCGVHASLRFTGCGGRGAEQRAALLLTATLLFAAVGLLCSLFLWPTALLALLLFLLLHLQLAACRQEPLPTPTPRSEEPPEKPGKEAQPTAEPDKEELPVAKRAAAWRLALGSGGGVRILQAGRRVEAVAGCNNSAAIFGRGLAVRRGERGCYKVRCRGEATRFFLGWTADVHSIASVWLNSVNGNITAYGGYRSAHGAGKEEALEREGAVLTVHVDLAGELGRMWLECDGRELGVNMEEEEVSGEKEALQRFLKAPHEEKYEIPFQFYPPLQPYIRVFSGALEVME